MHSNALRQRWYASVPDGTGFRNARGSIVNLILLSPFLYQVVIRRVKLRRECGWPWQAILYSTSPSKDHYNTQTKSEKAKARKVTRKTTHFFEVAFFVYHSSKPGSDAKFFFWEGGCIYKDRFTEECWYSKPLATAWSTSSTNCKRFTLVFTLRNGFFELLSESNQVRA